jgi:hypothetical protein
MMNDICHTRSGPQIDVHVWFRLCRQVPSQCIGRNLGWCKMVKHKINWQTARLLACVLCAARTFSTHVHMQNRLLDHLESYGLSRRDLDTFTWNSLLGVQLQPPPASLHCKAMTQQHTQTLTECTAAT